MSPEERSLTIDSAGGIAGEDSEIGSTLFVGERQHDLPPLRTTGRDLLRVGTAILSADRLARRQPFKSRGNEREMHWQRSLAVKIAVENPTLWRNNLEPLREILRFLTDDDWQLSFLKGRSPGNRQQPLFPESVPSNSEIVLFSGGLDSTAGLLSRHLSTGNSFIPVSVCGNPKQRRTQETTTRALVEAGASLFPVSIVHQIRRRLPRRDATEENTQRARAVAYLFLAAAIADAAAVDNIVSFEAGPGALNLSMHDSQVGAQNTRATHPHTLHLIQRFLRLITQNNNLRVSLPFIFRTKGEVCASLPPKHLMRLAELSCSCDESEGRKPNITHCGYCTSCLMRRAALYAALGDKDPSIYLQEPRRKMGHYHLESYRYQALSLQRATAIGLRECLLIDPTLEIAVVALAETEGIDRKDAEDGIIALLSRSSGESLRWLDTHKGIGDT